MKRSTHRSEPLRRSLRVLAGAVVLLGLVGCEADPGSNGDFPLDDSASGKTDIFGRALAGVAAPFTPNPLLAENEEELRLNIRARRDAAWATAHHALEPVPLLGLAERVEEEVESSDGEAIPEVPRWQTWYGIDDLRRIFQTLYEGAEPSDRVVRAAFSDEDIEAAFVENANSIDRSRRWPLERYLRYVEMLGICDEGVPEDECARMLGSNFCGSTVGNSRILYSPGTAQHIVQNYGPIMECLEGLDTFGIDAEVSDMENFSSCFESEFPSDAVLIKAQWVRADFGMDIPVFDTDAEAMERRLGGAAEWETQGDRRADPTNEEIVTIRLRNGDTYRLAGLHIMTKELRHWQWITMFWSETPDDDFGADRPASFLEGIDPVWGNYKMCVATWYEEEDPDPVARYDDDHPSLAAALRATGSVMGAPTWCSNPYVEHGRGNAATNCIGCHQHGGATVAHDLDEDGTSEPFVLERVIDDDALYPDFGRVQQRELFVADYLYSFNRVDDFAGMISAEVAFFERQDADAVAPRINSIGMVTDPDAAEGEATFLDNCAQCHGDDGMGSERAPSLFDRVPMRPDNSILRTIIQGRGGMPSWGDDFDDRQIAELLAYLRATFGAAPEE